MRISDWSSDVCSSDLPHHRRHPIEGNLPLHGDAGRGRGVARACSDLCEHTGAADRRHGACRDRHPGGLSDRSEEHTSELQSLMRISYAVLCLKKKKTNITTNTHIISHHTQ